MVRENGMVMISEEEYCKLNKQYQENEILRSAVMKMIKNFQTKPTSDIYLSRREFLAVYNAALSDMFERGDDNNEIYGHDVTVHWHGFYCNCEDGATVTNTVIDGVECCSDELGDEE